MILYHHIESTKYPRDIIKVFYYQQNYLWMKIKKILKELNLNNNIINKKCRYLNMKILIYMPTNAAIVTEILFYHTHMNLLASHVCLM